MYRRFQELKTRIQQIRNDLRSEGARYVLLALFGSILQSAVLGKPKTKSITMQNTPAEEIMAALNKLQSNYDVLARSTNISHNNMTAKEVASEMCRDLEKLKKFAGERLGINPNFKG